MQSALNCSICHPPELDRLIASEPGFAAHWLALARRQVAAKTALHRAGLALGRSWLVERGLVRTYYLSAEGREHDRSFHTQGSWVGSGHPPVPSICPYTIETMEPSQLVELDYSVLQDWQRLFPAIRPLLDDAMNHLFASQARREAELLALSPTQRYVAFLSEYSALLKRIPQHHVASYLGVTSVSLSRIRARMGLIASERS